MVTVTTYINTEDGQRICIRGTMSNVLDVIKQTWRRKAMPPDADMYPDERDTVDRTIPDESVTVPGDRR